MARGRFNLAAMDVEELIRLREEIGGVLSHKAAELKQQLERLETENGGSSRATRGRRGRPRKGRKIPPKYRDPENPSMVWAGRGVRPRWMQERIKGGAKQEDFLISPGAQSTRGRRKSTRKASRGRGRPRKAA